MIATGRVAAVAAARGHRFSKRPQLAIRLVPGIGVAGDSHAGITVKHRSRVARDPSQPNLRQVHLIGIELFAELGRQGFEIGPADLGENVATSGLDLLGLPTGARLRLGSDALVEVTGLRNPCIQIERFRPGLLAAVMPRGPDGRPVRRAGIMGVVLAGGDVAAGDPVVVELPEPPHRPLAVV